MTKVQANTRLDQDTADRLEQHADEHDMTKAEVLRRATREYLADRGHEVPATDGGVTTTTTDEIQRAVHLSNAALGAGLLWVGAVVALDPPAAVTVASGAAVAVALGVVLATGVRR